MRSDNSLENVPLWSYKYYLRCIRTCVHRCAHTRTQKEVKYMTSYVQQLLLFELCLPLCERILVVNYALFPLDAFIEVSFGHFNTFFRFTVFVLGVQSVPPNPIRIYEISLWVQLIASWIKGFFMGHIIDSKGRRGRERLTIFLVLFLIALFWSICIYPWKVLFSG